MKIGFETDIGKERKVNEDSFSIVKKYKVFSVADGLGAYNAGDYASSLAVNHISQSVEDGQLLNIEEPKDIIEYFANIISQANFKIFKRAISYEENSGMASTLVVAYIKDNMLFAFNVGDSRCYLLDDHKLIQITEDHSYPAELMRRGEITKEEAQNHIQKNELTRAVGAEHIVKIDCFKRSIKEGNVILLCTDGLTNMVEEEDIRDILDRSISPQEKCSLLVDMANENGGGDNITVVAVEITEDDIHEQ